MASSYLKAFQREQHFEKLARQAKRAKLADFDPKALTTGQKAYLTKLSNTHGKILEHPEKFFKRKISQETAKLLKSSDHVVVGTKLFLEKQGDTSVKVRRTHEGNIDIVRIAKSAKTVREKRTRIHNDPLHIFKEIDRLQKRLERGGMEDLGPYSYVTGKFGDNSPFNQKFDSLDLFRKYLEKFNTNQLRYLTLVTYTDDDDADEADI